MQDNKRRREGHGGRGGPEADEGESQAKDEEENKKEMSGGQGEGRDAGKGRAPKASPAIVTRNDKWVGISAGRGTNILARGFFVFSTK